MDAASREPDTVVLIHGFWVTPRSWENWIDRYQDRGYRVIAPTYPGFESDVEALNADPTPIATVTVGEIIDHLASVVADLPSPPILMGHSAGGAFVQILLDRGFGAAGVAINSAPTEGVPVFPPSQVKSLLPVFRNPANRRKAVGFTPQQWRYAFANTLTEDQSKHFHQRYAIPASGRILFQTALANLGLGDHQTRVDYRNSHRAPLLFISGAQDHLMPPSVQRSNARHYTSNAVTEVKEYPGRAHLLPAQEGWEEIADYALSWAARHARETADHAPPGDGPR
ncbi:MAG: alpha/beta hydrolase [Micromonosporaceae bacterium]